MLGNAPEPQSAIERGSLLIAHAEALGMDPLVLRDADVDVELARRYREQILVWFSRR